MLFLSIAASGRSIQASRCPQAQAQMPHKAATAWATPVKAAQPEAVRPLPEYVTTGVDLEVRIWNVRIEFPWLKTLPVTPGRHIVVSLWETEP